MQVNAQRHKKITRSEQISGATKNIAFPSWTQPPPWRNLAIAVKANSVIP
jgi:hypothetical protein